MVAARQGQAVPWICMTADIPGVPATPPGSYLYDSEGQQWYIADTMGNWQPTDLPPPMSVLNYLRG